MNRFKSIVLAVAAALVATAYAVPAPTTSAASASLSIVPNKKYTIEPGRTINDKLTIRNLDAEQPLELTLRVVDFTFTDDGGTPKLLLDENEPQTTWSLKPYLNVPQTVSVPPRESQTVDMSVAMPQGIGGGSYYSAIVYSSGAPDGGNVGLSASGVTLAFVQVPGDVKEDLKLEKFGAYQQASGDNAGGYKYFNTNAPKSLAFTLKNSGNVVEAPVGSISLKHMFGREQIINDVNPNGSLALIGQSRTFVSCIKLKEQEVDFEGQQTQTKTCDDSGLWPGYYSAKLNLFYGQNGNRTQEINSDASFWYLPVWFILVLLALLSVVAFFIWRLVNKVQGKFGGPKVKKKSSRRR